MDRGLAGQRRYLAALDDAAGADPDACVNQRAALARERALAAAAPDAAAYRAASGDLFELARGQWLDRLIGHARIAAAVDDPWAVAAARIELDAALAAHAGGWAEQLQAGAAAAAPVRAAGADAIGAYTGLLWALVRARVEGRPVERADALGVAAAARARLAALDAGFDPHAPAPRYRWRTPWTGAGLATLAGWIDAIAVAPGGARAEAPDGAAALAAMEAATAAWRAGLPGRGGAAPVGGEPSIADVVAPYAGLAGLAGDAPEVATLRAAAQALVAAAAGAATPQDVLAAWAEQGLLVALGRAPIEAGLVRLRERLTAWPEPLLAHHVDALAAALSAARTTTTIDLASVHADACLAVEADWNRALAAVVLAPARATFIAAWDGTADARRGIAAAWSVAHALCGAGADLDGNPWVAGFVRDVIVRHGGGPPEELGAGLGEVGAETLADARVAIALARAGGELTVLDEPAVRGWLRARAGTPPAPAAGAVRLWDREAALADVLDLARAPARPGRFGAGAP